MPRKPRKYCKSEIYHIILRGNNKQLIFLEDSDCYFFISRIKKYSVDLKIDIYSYCLMDNHVHILLGKANQSLSRFVQKLATSYAMYFNRKYERSGHLFQGRFKSEPVETDQYFKTAERYILRNPQKSHNCDFTKYKWSSYSHLMNENSFENTDFVYQIFENKNNFISFVANKNDDQCMEYENKLFFSDSHCMKIIRTIFKINTPEIIGEMPKEKQLDGIRKLKQMGIPINQLVRLTGIPRKVLKTA